MDSEDQSEFLQSTDEDESSEEDDEQTSKSSDLQVTKSQKHAIFSKFEFYITVLAVMASSTLLTIFLPIYLEILKSKSNTYVMIQFTSLLSVVILIGIILVAKKVSSRYTTVMFSTLPICWKSLLKISLIYTICGFMVVYSVDQKRVVCHIQDPIKGLVLVFSLVYYFLFCKQLMKLQSIFSATAIVVGLFVSIDYGLCNKFRCRGQTYDHTVTDNSSWTWQIHTLWTIIYIGGLALYSGVYTMLERCLVPAPKNLQCSNRTSFLLTTISCLVSSRDANSIRNQVISEVMPIMNVPLKRKVLSSLHLITWIHIFVWVFTTCLFWINFVPSFGKISSGEKLMNITESGFLCHFSAIDIITHTDSDCANLSLYGWIFLLSYITYTLSSIHFLIMSQSAVFVFSVTIVSLPLTFIWWSLFRMDVTSFGVLIWAPTITGELICSILGLPIILIGLFFLSKWHFQEQVEVQRVIDSFHEN